MTLQVAITTTTTAIISGLLLSFSSQGAMAAQSLDVMSKADVSASAKAASQWLNYHYFSYEFPGAWGQTVVQWHESGMFYNTYMDYRKYSGDKTWDTFVNSQMVAATFGNTGDFLRGGNEYSGKWNDDIAWWGLAGAETYGTTAVIQDPEGMNIGPTGATWFSLADKTWNHMLEQWDETICGGGIYWSRNRDSTVVREKFYKSTISNAEAVSLAARMFALSGNQTYKVWGDKIYGWMKTKLIMTDYSVLDGVIADDPNDCLSISKMDPTPWTYHTGEIISGLVNFYTATKDPFYLNEAQNHFAYIMQTFINPQTGAFYDPTCYQNGGNTLCKSPSGYTWPLYRAVGFLYRATTDNQLKKDIVDAMTATANEVFQHCDSKWNCIRTFTGNDIGKYMFENGTNPRDQIEVMEILNSFMAINGFQTVNVGAQVTTLPNAGNGQKSDGVSVIFGHGGFGVGVLVNCLIASAIGLIGLVVL
ncbi:hydrolase 76 protein [Blyttiomyces sp. JEL0837]|nr:hydrolase 76 protein [Blyttiomyces sp. JEL0837]